MRSRFSSASILVGAVLVAAWFGTLGHVLVRPVNFVFRDAAHYYHPLYKWIESQHDHGESAHWLPHENCGVDLTQDVTASLSYPAKLIFRLPASFDFRFKLYVTLHLLWGMFGACCLTKAMTRGAPQSWLASGVSGLAYGLGGHVLFQYCNIVYLVGAGWLPWSLLFIWRSTNDRRLLDVILAGACLALMVLGGDPQSAYNAAIAAALLMLLRFCRRWRLRRRAKRRNNQTIKVPLNVRRAFSLTDTSILLGLAGCGVLLSAIQLLPSLEHGTRSDRYPFARPRSVYELPMFLARQPSDSIGETCRAFWSEPPQGHHAQIYSFSLAPWQLMELLWPNVSGQPYPINARWTRILPADSHPWVASLYLGILPLALALARWRLWRGATLDRWLAWIAMLTLLASFGWFGVGWLVREFWYALGGDQNADWLPGSPTGGIYWFMATTFPGYSMFRFPAKLFVMTQLAIAVLAGRQFAWRSLSRLVPLLKLCAIFTLVATVVPLCLARLPATTWERIPADHLFGPFVPAVAWTDMSRGLLHTLLVCCAALFLLRKRSPQDSCERHSKPLLLIVAIDLVCANAWMIKTAPAEFWAHQPEVAQELLPGENDNVPVRIHRGLLSKWTPSEFRLHSAKDRHASGFRWDRETLFPKHQLEMVGGDVQVVESFGSSSPYDLQMLLALARRHGWQRPDGIREPHLGVLRQLGTSHLVAASRRSSYGRGTNSLIHRQRRTLDTAPRKTMLDRAPGA